MLTQTDHKSPAITDLFKNFIAAKGLNMSRQRTLILEAFLSSGPRISVDDLYIKLRHRQATLGRTTVYRTLKLLAECGIARAIIVGGVPIHYEKCASNSAVHAPSIHSCTREEQRVNPT